MINQSKDPTVTVVINEDLLLEVKTLAQELQMPFNIAVEKGLEMWLKAAREAEVDRLNAIENYSEEPGEDWLTVISDYSEPEELPPDQAIDHYVKYISKTFWGK